MCYSSFLVVRKQEFERRFESSFLAPKTWIINPYVNLTPALAQELHKLRLNLGACLNNNFMLQ